MYIISKEYSFSAGHHLDGLSPDHPCRRPHGHNYIVRVTLASETLDSIGMVLDYNQMDPIRKFLDTVFDHRDLNEVVDFNPTAENLAKYLYEVFLPMFPQLVSVGVQETPKTQATYTEWHSLGMVL